MEKRSKVKRVTGSGTWESQYGTMYRFEVEFENGDCGDYNSKSKDQQNFIIGQDVSYELTSKEYQGKTFYTIKPAKPSAPPSVGGKDPETSKKITRMSVLKCATDLVVHEKIRFDTIFEWAKMMEAYIETGENQIPIQSPSNDGLPF